jgi:hypothetical protein
MTQGTGTKEIRRLAGIAREAGLEVEYLDYGWTALGHNKRLNKTLVIAEVYRAERDGYTGFRVICEDVLHGWIKDNPVDATDSTRLKDA